MRFEARINIIFKKNLWVVVKVKLKKNVIDIGIFIIIVCKFSYWQEVYLVILILIYKSFEICLYYTIFSFCLAISLKIKGHKKFY